MKMSLPRIIAHRGFSACYPDNTWTAIRAAQAAGVECCEIDLMLSADGEVIISHDYFISERHIAEMQSSEVRQQLVDSPRFEELLDWCDTQRMELLLEVKDDQIIDRLSKSLNDRDPELITIGSFHAPFLKAFKAVRPEFVTSLMLGTVFDLDEMVLLSRRYQCDAVHPCWESRAPYPHRLLSVEAITRLHEAGLKVIVWHEESEDELRCLLDLGVDGICTNDPERLKNLRDRA
ncbi:MAG: glycerophosphodiester phosphodiesterase [Proteobacteria bacterium]|nr:glycerophosphodiester phosphodiesterase [Pseudomonadota bacterium]